MNFRVLIFPVGFSYMEDHLILHVDQLVAPQEVEAPVLIPKASCSHGAGLSTSVTDRKEDREYDASGEEEPLIQSVECRICQEEDSIKNLEFAHRKCVQRWCNEKRDVPHSLLYSYFLLPTPLSSPVGSWTLAGTPLDLNDPRVLAMAAERRLLETDYDEYEDNSASGALFCRSAAIILMALLLLRHALTIGDGDSDDDDPFAFFAEAETLAAADVAFMIPAGQHRNLQVTIAPGPAMAPTTPMVIPIPAASPTHESLQ
ncbi:Protein of unknown function DUF3675 [Cynara cardunculus var. scolymus]|uniref:RING-CH-type domain-containing protein n=1 Tax=Cynara cardunculus var. scolymus TaxID=59895 RepID=A0A103XXY3_CYNCS|nr:Protein of unknown function DUF3675 [Cynara cardunculus var. scolymus]